MALCECLFSIPVFCVCWTTSVEHAANSSTAVWQIWTV